MAYALFTVMYFSSGRMPYAPTIRLILLIFQIFLILVQKNYYFFVIYFFDFKKQKTILHSKVQDGFSKISTVLLIGCGGRKQYIYIQNKDLRRF